MFHKALKFKRPMMLQETTEEAEIPFKKTDLKVERKYKNPQMRKANYVHKRISVEEAQRFKDKFLVSNRVLFAIRKYIRKDFPGYKKLRKFREDQATKIETKQNEYGYFNSIKSKVEFILSKVGKDALQNFATIDENDDQKQVFILKFAGDGTNVSRNIKVFNLVFSCMNETNKCQSASGHYTLGVFAISQENKLELGQAMSEISLEIKNLQHVEIQKKNIESKNTSAGT